MSRAGDGQTIPIIPFLHYLLIFAHIQGVTTWGSACRRRAICSKILASKQACWDSCSKNYVVFLHNKNVMSFGATIILFSVILQPKCSACQFLWPIHTFWDQPHNQLGQSQLLDFVSFISQWIPEQMVEVWLISKVVKHITFWVFVKVKLKCFGHPQLKEQWLEVWSRYRGVRVGWGGGTSLFKSLQNISLNF